MKPLPRIRKTIKWGGAVVTLLLVVVWVGSGWYVMAGPSPIGGTWGMQIGCYFFDEWAKGWGTPAESRVRRYRGGYSHVELWPVIWSRDRARTQLWVPGWMPVIPAIACTALAWRLDALARRRARTTHCPKCGYDRAGIAVGAKCPECGAAPMSR